MTTREAPSARPPRRPGFGPPGGWHPTATYAGLLLLALASMHWTKLAPAACFLTLVGFLALPPLKGGARRVALTSLGVAALTASVGFFRFALEEAIPGVIAGGRDAAKKHALAFARTLVTAQDHLRRAAVLDHDADGIGSAASLLELTGLAPLRNGGSLTTPPVYVTANSLRSTPHGAAVRVSGYLYRICLPTPDGGYTAQSPPPAVDEERAERDYLIYAWPAQEGSGSPQGVLFLDAYETILEYQAPEGGARFHGAMAGPSCDSALDNPDWKPWKDKTPRERLPGDEAVPQPTTH